MKTKDFIGYIEERGGHVNRTDHYVRIWQFGDILAVVSSDRVGKVNIEDYDRLIDNNMLQLIVEYSTTPLDKREEEKKRYVKICDGYLGYLNINTFLDKMSVDDVYESGSIKTKFTDKEIEDLKQREDIPLDWNKVHFEDAE